MSKIKIKNFGPIKNGYEEDDGFIDIKKVTIFIGNQGSGKSTIAKTIASMAWLEKALNRGDINEPKNLAFFHKLFSHLRLGDEYFNDHTEIEYRGDLYTIRYSAADQYPVTVKNGSQTTYQVPKIMYVPAERNFLSVVQKAYDVKGLPASLFEFAEEFRRAQKELKGEELNLPIQGYRYLYNERDDKSFVVADNHKIDLLEASSGFQSIIPLFVVSSNLGGLIKSGSAGHPLGLSVDQSLRMANEITSVMSDEALSDNEKINKVKSVQARYKNEIFINIVEEPEQNLYPASQQKMLYELLRFNNMTNGNKLIITTHSPYLINYLTLAVEAGNLKGKSLTEENQKQIEEIVPLSARLDPDDLVVYELNEKSGTIEKLENYKGLPSDENLLNEKLGESNEQFTKLMEIAQKS